MFQFELFSPELHVLGMCTLYCTLSESLLGVITVYEEVFQMFKEGVTVSLD